MMRTLSKRIRRMIGVRVSIVALSLLGYLSATGRADDKASLLEKQALEVIESNCLTCHGKTKPKAGLDLSTKESLLRGANSGPILVPGKSGESLLLQVVRPKGKPHMPPRDQLAKEEIAVLQQWIDSLKPTVAIGKLITDKDRAHWAFQKLHHVKPPEPKNTKWVRSPLDAFILAQLEAKGLTPAPAASKLELIRR